MQQLHASANPFALMLDPQAVFAQIERSGCLERLQRRVCRPLDKPLLGATVEDSGESDSAEPTGDDGEALSAVATGANFGGAAPNQ